ncbi:uncharacterized protein EV422DRAFT_243182 [Fimicolochytrium jonesii]|uniref:uncharacterized protein n=1 Tax=Fimicolochytrium jonesii TaxID=1396493 RepID=UPI0022FF248E|nr:uncharacterized protein EV422DRAFT_243182 [Fimicolochytrium jonesii]KAI8825039.1 hypothetical protein EV422DRAFT_243182 [Fimicolochytrium jonesii]
MGVIAWLAVTTIGGAALLVPPAAPVVGGILGFSRIGPVAGTIAASAQAYVGAVAAGSTFAVLQSAAMLAPTL